MKNENKNEIYTYIFYKLLSFIKESDFCYLYCFLLSKILISFAGYKEMNYCYNSGSKNFLGQCSIKENEVNTAMLC